MIQNIQLAFDVHALKDIVMEVSESVKVIKATLRSGKTTDSESKVEVAKKLKRHPGIIANRDKTKLEHEASIALIT